LMAIMVRWQIVFKSEQIKLASAAAKLEQSLEKGNLAEHKLSRHALPISQLILGKNALIFHSLKCTGAARRFAAQINENGKQPAFAVLMPEGLHNAIEGISGGHPNEWTLIYFTDPDDPEFLTESLGRSMEFVKKKGFNVVVFPAMGENQYELTLARILLGDLVSVFLAVLRGIDPTYIPAIETLKSGNPI
jgi:glucose/mannose-6-phosphate isomerase